jgi:hypothetical protein
MDAASLALLLCTVHLFDNTVPGFDNGQGPCVIIELSVYPDTGIEDAS